MKERVIDTSNYKAKKALETLVFLIGKVSTSCPRVYAKCVDNLSR